MLAWINSDDKLPRKELWDSSVQSRRRCRRLYTCLANCRDRWQNIGMAKQKRSATSWSACKTVIKNWPAAGLQGLVHELYQLSKDNQRFLHARLLPEASAQTLEQTSRALAKVLSVSSVFADRFRHADAKQIIDQYAKATDDPVALCDLLISDLERSCKTFSEVGDFEPMADHLYATLNRLEKVSADLPTESLVNLSPRLKDLAQTWGRSFGYGISDELIYFASEWLRRAGVS
jgi:hypothetical protein